jgi:hypothetical protein
MPSSTLQVWKVIHAETIRSIWASRCKKVFEDADTQFLELKAKLVAQIEYKLTIHANLLQSRPKKGGLRYREFFRGVFIICALFNDVETLFAYVGRS